MTESPRLEDLVRTYYDVVDRGDVPALLDLFAQDAIYNRPGYEPLHGRDELAEFYTQRRIIAEGKHTLEMVIAGADCVAVAGTFAGVAYNGDTLAVRFADFFRVAEGHFTRRDTYFDVAAV